LKKLRISIITTSLLGVVAFALFILERLALQDIWQAIEPDLSLEWSIVRLAFLPTVFFFISALVTAVLISKHLTKETTD